MSEIADAVDRVLPSVRADLEKLIEIPSVSSDPEHAADVERSAEFVADRLRELGAEVEIVSADGGKPAVIASFPAPEGKPTVTLYAHHDVQPTGDASRWSSDPFTPTERGERLYARGAADDKGGVGVHLAALRAFDGRPPVGVKLFIEGEEELASPTLEAVFAEHGHKLACDVFVIADSGNWEQGEPSFTTTLRGSADLVVEVATLDHGLHSGQYGGAVPDALMALTRMLTSLHDDDGNVAVEGFATTTPSDLDYPESRLREEAGVLEGVQLIGSGSIVERIWSKPSLTVIGIDTTSVDKASNTLIPRVRAKVAIRVAPGDDPAAAIERVGEHLKAHAPFGAQVTVTPGAQGAGFQVSLDGPLAEVARRAYTQGWGLEPVEMGMGGSIPLANAFQKLHPDALILATAVVDPNSRMHSTDESLHLGDFAAACRSEALFLQALAEG